MKPSLREATDRFVAMAFKENPDIKDIRDFENALKRKMTEEWRGENFLGQFNEEELIHFFNSPECKNRMKENLTEKEYDEMYEEIKRGEVYVERAKPKGEKIKPEQIRVFRVEKKIFIKTHSRAGRSVNAYYKSYRKWGKNEIKFLQIRKAKKMPIKQILYAYNSHFKGEERSPNSLKTKVYRL